MKILFITDRCDPLGNVGSLKLGGINIYSLNLPYYLSKLGVVVDVFTPAYSPSDQPTFQVNRNLRYVRILEGPTPGFKNSILKYIEENNLRYNLIHSNFWFGGLAAMEIADQLKLPQLHIYHTHGKLRQRILKQFNLDKKEPQLKARLQTETMLGQRATKIVATSYIEKDLLQKNYSIPKNKMEIIPIGVDTSLFKPVKTMIARKALGLDLKNPIILFVGRMEFNKGPQTLIDAFKTVSQKYPNATLCFVGGNKQKDASIKNLKKKCQELGISSKVKFFGCIDQNALYLYYSAADVCVMPTYYEIFGIVPLESMACGTPVVASRTGGLKFTILNGKTGYLAKTQDALDFADKIDLVLKKGKDNFSRNCIERIDELFLWPKIAAKYKTLYQQTMIKSLNQEASVRQQHKHQLTP